MYLKLGINVFNNSTMSKLWRRDCLQGFGVSFIRKQCGITRVLEGLNFD